MDRQCNLDFNQIDLSSTTLVERQRSFTNRANGIGTQGKNVFFFEKDDGLNKMSKQR